MLFTERILILRQNISKTRKEVAKDLSLAESTYGKYELGHRQPSLEILSKLADYFGVSVDYLLGRTDNPAPLPQPHLQLSPEEMESFKEWQKLKNLPPVRQKAIELLLNEGEEAAVKSS